MAQTSEHNPEQVHATVVLAVQRYFPLQAGRMWTYVEQVATPSAILLLERRVTLTIYSKHQNEYVAHWDFQSGQPLLPNIRYRVLDDGVQQAQLTGDTAYTPFFHFLKAPLVVGNSWRIMSGTVMRVSAVRLFCVVSAGAFQGCVEILREDNPIPESRVVTQYRFAPDIGLIWQQRRLFQRDRLERIDTMELQKLPEPSQL
jgi:hypothetical protein